MMQNDPRKLSVAVATRGQQPAALRLVFDSSRDGDPRIQSTLEMARRDPASFDGLFVGVRGGRVVAAAWTQILDTGVAAVWPPRLADDDESTANRLLDEIDAFLLARNCRYAQAILAGAAGRDAHRLRSRGFRQTADVLCLAAERNTFPTARPNQELQFVAVRLPDRARLTRLVRATFQGTLDFPELDGGCDDRWIDGVEFAEQHGARRWLILKQSQDVGCCLLVDEPADSGCRLAYLGVVPAARGRGLGLALTRHAQWLARRSGHRRMVLHVSDANGPAKSIYAAAGFRVADRRAVLLKVR